MAVRDPDVSPVTRHLVHAFLLVFAVTGIAHVELFPFSGFRLFSEIRTDERVAWQLRAVTRDGEELPIRLEDLTLGYRQTTRLIPDFAEMDPSERDAICDAWLGPLRASGVEAVRVRIYQTVTVLRPDAGPPDRTLLHECGGRVP